MGCHLTTPRPSRRWPPRPPAGEPAPARGAPCVRPRTRLSAPPGITRISYSFVTSDIIATTIAYDSHLQIDRHEEGDCQEPHHPAPTVHCHGIQRVVESRKQRLDLPHYMFPGSPECQHEMVDGHEAEASARPHHQRGPGLVQVAARAQRHHARQRAVQGQHEAPRTLLLDLSIVRLCDPYSREACDSSPW